MSDTQIVKEFYNDNVMYEWERMKRHPIEFEVTKHYLDKYIQSGDRVLDIGGGPGRYSFYLAEKGCDVTLFDLSEGNIAFVKRKAHELNLKINTVQGDAREVDQLVCGNFDHVLLMGPMYHLLDEQDRVKAMNAALKLLKPGGIIFVSFISLYAGFSYFLSEDPQGVLNSSEQEYICCFLANETFCGTAFTRACFIAPQEILPFMERFSLEKLHFFGQESITSPAEKNICACEQDVVKCWVKIAIQTCEREEFLPYSAHLMYVGRYRGEVE